ncbi:MAG: glucan 1,4-alpha-glucosidase, partial [Acidimicrobiia bacterium]
MGTSIGNQSRVWFALSHGIIDEIYHPRIDTACIRDLGLLISDDTGRFLEEKRHARSMVRWLEEGVPAFELTNRLPGGIVVRKEILTDPQRDVLLQRTRIDGTGADLHVTALLAPHIHNRGGDNRAWVGDYKGIPMLFASGSETSLALAVDTGWVVRSVGYVGFSDGWQDVRAHGRLTWTYPRAGPGNVALAGEISVPVSG